MRCVFTVKFRRSELVLCPFPVFFSGLSTNVLFAAEDTTSVAYPEYLQWLHHIWNFVIISPDNIPITVGNIVIGFFLIILGFFVSRRISRQLAKRVLPRVLPNLGTIATFETLSFYILLTFLTLFALKVANVPLTVFTVLGGAIAIGIGFGSQNIVNNFISGIIIMLERPINIGDFIEVNGIAGTVESIGIRSTQVLLFDNRHLIVPNSSFLEKNVLNWTLGNDIVRTTVKVGVVYGSPIKQVQDLLIHATQDNTEILPNPRPVALFTDFGDNSLNFELLFWVRVRNLLARRKIESRVRFRVDELFRASNIVIAFPQRDVHLDSSRPIEVLLTKEHSKPLNP